MSENQFEGLPPASDALKPVVSVRKNPAVQRQYGAILTYAKALTAFGIVAFVVGAIGLCAFMIMATSNGTGIGAGLWGGVTWLVSCCVAGIAMLASGELLLLLVNMAGDLHRLASGANEE